MKLLCRQIFCLIIVTFFLSISGWAKPLPSIEKDLSDFTNSNFSLKISEKSTGPKLKTLPGVPSPNRVGLSVIRIRVDYDVATKSYTFGGAYIENSGTPALYKRSMKRNPKGSFQGMLVDATTGVPFRYDAIGTGTEFKELTRALTFRFPLTSRQFKFVMEAENSTTGAMEKVFESEMKYPPVPTPPSSVAMESRLLRTASSSDKLVVNFYSEKYVENPNLKPGSETAKERFFRRAADAVKMFESVRFPGLNKMEIHAVYRPSTSQHTLPLNHDTWNEKIAPLADTVSWLGLIHPYWNRTWGSKEGRWHDVVYPTREEQYRRGIGSVRYDYPIVLIDNDGYWGVGNFNELTAIPGNNNKYFGYLLIHEIGHYFGLNEEYDSGGPTELRFADDISEPWSPNITFQNTFQSIKWNHHIHANASIPTKSSFWSKSSTPKTYGAYPGGYADSDPHKRSHIPGKNCVMRTFDLEFCDICKEGIEDKIKFDLGH